MMAFGKYEVVERIGEGGFGQVFKGWDPLLKRWVAIKTVSLSAAMAKERFLREAEIVAGLRHPSIVTIYDFGEQDGVPYLVQEFLNGEDLAHKIARGDAIDLTTRIRWLIEVADGLAFAHARGIVHRDIKPSNVRVLDDGAVRIMDFGIAKVLHSDQQLTGTSVSVGTSGYVAPEQLEGREIDQRADIFSFGAMAYELMTGRKPFQAPTVQATLYKILTERPPAIPSVAPACPPRLVACIDKCLEKQRDDRYPDCTALAAELRATLAEVAAPSATAASAVAAAGTAAPVAATQAIESAGQPPAAPARASDPTLASPAPAASTPPDGSADAAAVRRQKFVVIAAVLALLVFGTWAVSAVVRPLLHRSSVDGVAMSGGAAGHPDSVAGDSTGMAGGHPDSTLRGDTALRVAADSPASQARTDFTTGTAGAGGRAGSGGAADTGSARSVPAGRRLGDARSGRPNPDTASGSAARQGSRAQTDTGTTASGNSRSAARGAIEPARVLVLIRGARPDAVASAESTVLSELTAEQRPVVDPDAIDDARASAAAARALAGDMSPAVGVGREYAAGIVVVADLRTDATEAVAGFITGSAVLTAKFYDTAKGTLLFSEKYQVGAGGIPGKAGPTETAAVTGAAEAVAHQLAQAILRKTGS